MTEDGMVLLFEAVMKEAVAMSSLFHALGLVIKAKTLLSML
jgi:hypothetical protein